MTTESTQPLEPCPLTHPIKDGLNLWGSSAGRKWHIWCHDCGLQFEGRLDQPKDDVIKIWNSRVSASTGPVVDAAWKVAVEIANDRLGPRSDSPQFWDKYAAYVKGVVEHHFPAASPNIQTGPTVDEQRCAECGHKGQLVNGRCRSTVLVDPCKGETDYCGCECKFLAASPVQASPDEPKTDRPICCAYDIAVQDGPIREGKELKCSSCGTTWFYHNVGGWKLAPVQASVPAEGGITWFALLAVLERLKSKTRNPKAEWYHGWNAAIQCLINDINGRSRSAPTTPETTQEDE